MNQNDVIEFDVTDIQQHFDNEPINLADLESFVSANTSGKRQKRQSPKNKNRTAMNTSNDAFYVSQVDYIEYLVEKRHRRKKQLRRKSLLDRLLSLIIWVFQFIIGAIIIIAVFWGFYMLCWYMQQTHVNF